MQDLQKEHDEIIELYGIQFSEKFHISPLAGRILGTLIIDGRKCGITFEDLIVKLKASKSSISTNLNLLLKMEKISYSTICGDRKKYYKAMPLSDLLNCYLKMLESELTITDKMTNYRELTASCAQEKCDIENLKAYKNHIDDMKELFLKTISEFQKIEIQNKKINN